MSQINLRSENIAFQKEASGGSTTSSILGAIILFVSLASYGGAYYYTESVKQKIANVALEKKEQQKSLSDKKWEELYNFEDRLTELRAKLGTRSNQSINLAKISAVTMPQTVFDSLKINHKGIEDEVEAEIIVPDFEVLYKQLKAFSLIPNVGTISPDTVAKEEEKNLGLKVSLKFTIKPSTPEEDKAVDNDADTNTETETEARVELEND